MNKAIWSASRRWNKPEMDVILWPLEKIAAETWLLFSEALIEPLATELQESMFVPKC